MGEKLLEASFPGKTHGGREKEEMGHKHLLESLPTSLTHYQLPAAPRRFLEFVVTSIRPSPVELLPPML
jgi:hypothetical protein